MPFALKFRAMMDFPFAGDTLGDFVVESVDVRDEREDVEGHAYAVQIVLRGSGGQQGVQRAIKSLFAARPTTFSGYGNPYQLWFCKPEIESLGDQRYQVRVKGMGVRVYLEPELARFLDYLDGQGHLSTQLAPSTREALVETYLGQYRSEIARQVGRYRRELSKAEDKNSKGGSNDSNQ